MSRGRVGPQCLGLHDAGPATSWETGRCPLDAQPGGRGGHTARGAFPTPSRIAREPRSDPFREVLVRSLVIHVSKPGLNALFSCSPKSKVVFPTLSSQNTFLCISYDFDLCITVIYGPALLHLYVQQDKNTSSFREADFDALRCLYRA